MSKDIIEINSKGELHGRYESYHDIYGKLMFKCNYYNGTEFGLEVWSSNNQIRYHV